MKRKPKKQRSIIVRLLVLGVCAYMAITLGNLWNNLNEANKELKKLQQQKEIITVEIEGKFRFWASAEECPKRNTHKQNNLTILLKKLFLDYSLLLRFDNLITATQMHEGEETQQNTVR